MYLEATAGDPTRARKVVSMCVLCGDVTLMSNFPQAPGSLPVPLPKAVLAQSLIFDILNIDSVTCST